MKKSINAAAAALGKLGGAKKSPAKTAANRANIAKRWAKVREKAGISEDATDRKP